LTSAEVIRSREHSTRRIDTSAGSAGSSGPSTGSSISPNIRYDKPRLIRSSVSSRSAISTRNALPTRSVQVARSRTYAASISSRSAHIWARAASAGRACAAEAITRHYRKHVRFTLSARQSVDKAPTVDNTRSNDSAAGIDHQRGLQRQAMNMRAASRCWRSCPQLRKCRAYVRCQLCPPPKCNGSYGSSPLAPFHRSLTECARRTKG
jgi:hypothetical protein